MKKKYLIILLLTMVLMPFKVFAAGGFGVSESSVTLHPGDTKTIMITSDNAVGKLNISSSNGGVASVDTGSIFIQNPGSSGSVTITAGGVGTATISVVGSSDFATMDEEILEGYTKTITVNVIPKPAPVPQPTPEPTPEPTPQPSPVPGPSQPQQQEPPKSTNNKIKELVVEGYELVRVDDNNYTLTVTNDVTSVTVNASAEDEKAQLAGVGAHELQVGENNIEVVITAESGDQNKININITRKDGYYLEDLDKVLKNDSLVDADIIINADSKISKEQIQQIKDSSKVLRLNYYNENKKLLYSWTIDGKEIKDTKEVITSVTYTTENIKEIYKLSNYADGLYINFNHNGELPGGTKIKLYVGDKFENESLVNLYHYNINKKTLDFIKDNLKVVDGYIEFDINNCSEYFVTMSSIGTVEKIEDAKEDSLNIFMIFTIIAIVIIIALVLFIFIKLKPNKKEVLNVRNTDTLASNNNTNFDSESSLNNIEVDNYFNDDVELNNIKTTNISGNSILGNSESNQIFNTSNGVNNYSNNNEINVNSTNVSSNSIFDNNQSNQIFNSNNEVNNSSSANTSAVSNSSIFGSNESSQILSTSNSINNYSNNNENN